MQPSVGNSINGGIVLVVGTASVSGGIGACGTVLIVLELACSSVRDTCGADDVDAGGAASDTVGVGVGDTVLPGVDLACS